MMSLDSLTPPLVARNVVRPWYWPTKQFRWQMLLFPWFVPLVTYLLLGPDYLRHWSTLAGATGLNLTLGVVCQWLLDQATKQIADHYPGLGQTVARLVLLLLAFMSISGVVVLGGLWVYGYFHLFGYVYQPDVLRRILLFNVVVNLISVGTTRAFIRSPNGGKICWRRNSSKK